MRPSCTSGEQKPGLSLPFCQTTSADPGLTAVSLSPGTNTRPSPADTDADVAQTVAAVAGTLDLLRAEEMIEVQAAGSGPQGR